MLRRRAFLAACAAAVVPAGAAADEGDDGAGLGHALTEVGPDFPKRAPAAFTVDAVLPAPPTVVFDTLADPAPWPLWLPLVEHVAYRRPFGPGTERDVTTSGGLGVIRERFFAWERGERFAFSVTSSTTPLLESFYEDYLLKPVQGGSTRLVWTVAAAAKPWAFFAAPAVITALKTSAPPSLSRLAEIVRARAARGT